MVRAGLARRSLGVGGRPRLHPMPFVRVEWIELRQESRAMQPGAMPRVSRAVALDEGRGGRTGTGKTENSRA